MKIILKTLQREALLLENVYNREGFWFVIREGTKHVVGWPIDILTAFYYKYLNRNRPTFIFQGKTYNYFYNRYNVTWKNERSLEIPIIWNLVQENSDKKILEIGNVLSHYFACHHDVVDLYEEYPGVINEDIVNFRPAEEYDLIVSISTFEHIGCWDNKPREPEKLLAAIQNVVENILAPEGKLVITIPLGQNTEMEKVLASGKISFTYLSCLKRASPRTKEWKEVEWAEIRGKEFNSDGVWCNTDRVFLVGVIRKLA